MPTSAGVRDRSDPELPGHLTAHLGTAAVPVRLRRLDDEMFRLTLSRPLPVETGDRLVLRDPGRHTIVAGAVVLDADPPELRRRGAAAARARDLRRAVEGDEVLANTRWPESGWRPTEHCGATTSPSPIGPRWSKPARGRSPVG